LRRQKSDALRRIAGERIDILLRLARKAARFDADLSKKYVESAIRIGMRSGVRLGHDRKQFICRKCAIALVPGLNCRVRMRSDDATRVVVTCLECGSNKQYPVVKERCSRRRECTP